MFFIDIGLAVLFALIQGRKIPTQYVRGLVKLRDALNAAIPLTIDGTANSTQLGKGFTITK